MSDFVKKQMAELEQIAAGRGMKLADAAKAVGIPQSTYYLWRSGNVKSVNLQLFAELSNYVRGNDVR